ncbi:hypothetical protein ACV331_35400, partial [Pseudomonas aeruginosa]
VGGDGQEADQYRADLLLQWLQRILTPKGLRASAH